MNDEDRHRGSPIYRVLAASKSCLSFLSRYFKNRPVIFWINLALVGTWLFLLWPLLSPVFLTPIYVAYVATLMLPAIGYAYLAVVGGAKINAGLLVVLVVGFAIGEIYVRHEPLAPENEMAEAIISAGQHPYYMYTGNPNSTYRMPRQQGGSDADRTFTFNSDGFRIERALEKNKPEQQLRIFVTGGSTVVFGAPLANTIPGLIESDLSKKEFPNAKVYNFGIIGAVSGQELALLTHKLVDYHPDIVISYGGGNDLHEPYQYDPRPGYPSNFLRLQMAADLLSDQLDFRSALASQVFRSQLIARILKPRAQEIRAPLGPARKSVGYRTPAWERKIIDIYRANLHHMCRMSRAFDFRFYAVLQPSIFQKAHLSAAESRLVFGDADFASYMRRQHDRAASAYKQLQIDDGADGKCRFLDLSQIFDNDPRNLFWDFIHINNAGNRTVAAAIADDLAPSFLHRQSPLKKAD
jgi:lysophospholipase L1-like esterase